MASSAEGNQLLTRLNSESKSKLKARFKQYDENGDGVLNIQELAALLNKSSAKFTQIEIRALFNACDTDKNGIIGFDEFVDFLHQDQEIIDAIVRSANKGKNVLKRTPSELADADVEAMNEIFTRYTGKDKVMKGNEFMRLCRTCDLFNDNFDFTEVDIVFARVCGSGKRSIGPEEFRVAIKLISEMRGEPGISVRARIVEKTRLFLPSPAAAGSGPKVDTGLERLAQPKVRDVGLDIKKMDIPNPLEGKFDKRPSLKNKLNSPALTSIRALSSGRIKSNSARPAGEDDDRIVKTRSESNGFGGASALNRRSMRARTSSPALLSSGRALSAPRRRTMNSVTSMPRPSGDTPRKEITPRRLSRGSVGRAKSPSPPPEKHASRPSSALLRKEADATPVSTTAADALQVLQELEAAHDSAKADAGSSAASDAQELLKATDTAADSPEASPEADIASPSPTFTSKAEEEVASPG